MTALKRGLYEALVTRALELGLRELEAGLVAETAPLRPAEAADRIALHLSRLVQRAVESIKEKERVEAGSRLAHQLVDAIHAAQPAAAVDRDALVSPTAMLRALLAIRPDGAPETIEAPLIPLLDTTLLTNAPGEPNVGHQIRTEIQSADRVDVVMAFIRRSGIAPMLPFLRRLCESGRALRVLTTTYTGSTEASALQQLQDAGARVKVSYDTRSTRLHAKAWLFHRASGFSTAYIGSSNLTHSAQVAGLEWNVRVSEARNQDVISKVAAVFESYWQAGDFVDFDLNEFTERSTTGSDRGTALMISPIEVRLEPFQARLLEQIELSRASGRHRNLLVSATGTGKTVMAAVDYAALRRRLPRARLLFVAHREEILQQSLATFRHALRDGAFGELWVGGRRPETFDHVFASIQSLRRSSLDHLAPDHFDVVIVDEFHHAAAESYRGLLNHVTPRQLLGLTATPERADGLSVLDHFDGRIAAELRLWDAIDQHRLVPFAYYGVHDGLDLRRVPWRRGGGYDVEGLTNLLTANDAWARLVIKQLVEHVDDVSLMRALGFCVSIDHARFMARVFSAAGIPAVAVWSDTPDAERKAALSDLAACRVNVVFSVDLFNEGVDVPQVDTLLLLRPTDSGTLFLQQLGRGLRHAEEKTRCTVLDFVGHHRKEFRFDRRFGALLGGSRREIQAQVERGFPFLPAGCHMQLDAVAREEVLRSLREAVPSKWTAKADELRALSRERGEVTLDVFLNETGRELEDVYAGTYSWSDLRDAAGLPTELRGSLEKELRRACGRLLHVDDSLRIATWRRLLSEPAPPDADALPEMERRLLRMLVGAVMPKNASKELSLADGARSLWAHPQVRTELLELLPALESRISHLPIALSALPDVPLRVHARYTRIEILAACGEGQGAKVAPWQSGVYWADSVPADLLAFTLDKTRGDFSPTTRYRDYAISRSLIHWESQSVTRADSDTGRRYREHATRPASRRSHVLLFARLNTDQRAFHFLGPATYVSHQSELPMAITWRLEHELPGDLFASFGAAVA